MEKSAWIAAGLTAALVSASVGYVVLDVLDVAPGMLTTQAPRAAASPPPALPTLAVGARARGQEIGPPLGSDSVAVVESAVADFAGAQLFARQEVTEEGPAEGGATSTPTVRVVPPASTAVLISDAVTGEVVAQHNAGQALTPASTLKTLAGMAVLGRVGGGKRLETAALIDQGTLYLRGGGDIYLAPDAGNPYGVSGRAGLGDLARATAAALKARGISSVQLVLDDTLFPASDAFNPKWEGSENYVGKVVPIAMNGTFEPEVGYYQDPALAAAQAFQGHLEAAGIAVEGEIGRAATPQEADSLAAVHSAPVFELVSRSLKESNNTSTEVECRLVAVAAGKPATFQGATEAVREFLTEVGVDTDGLVMDDCSGLSDASKVSPRTLVSVLQVARSSQRYPQLQLFDSALAFASVDGTLGRRYLEDTPLLRGKTGSLSNVASLSGTLVTKSGRPLDFAIIADGFAEGGLWGARMEIDSLIYAISEQ